MVLVQVPWTEGVGRGEGGCMHCYQASEHLGSNSFYFLLTFFVIADEALPFLSLVPCPPWNGVDACLFTGLGVLING